ncbi:MAG: TonB-dependent receptor [Bacteroidota bacterium]
MIRNSLFLSMVLVLLCSGRTFAQQLLQQPVRIQIENATPVDVLNFLEQEYAIPFLYNARDLPQQSQAYDLDNVALAKVLDQLMEGSELKYVSYRNRAIAILPKDKVAELDSYREQFYAALDGRIQQGRAPDEIITIGADSPGPAGSSANIVGRLVDATTGEPIIGATIYWSDLELGTATDSRGVWELDVPIGQHDLQIQYIGYGTFSRRFDILGDGFLDIKLRSEATDLETVIVLAEANDDNVSSIQAGLSTFSVRRIEELPALLGEADVVRSVLTSAGVTSIGEGSTGFNVRGGAVDQNLILQGGSVLFNASHALGFYSTINPEVVQDVSLYKSILPAEYGGRLASVLAVDLRRGNQEQLRIAGGLGPVTAKLSAEGPFAEGKGSFLLGVRAASADWVLRRVNVLEVSRSEAAFFDGNLLLHYDLTEKDQLSLSLYQSNDDFVYNQEFGFNFGNSSLEMGYTRQVREEVTSELSLVANQLRATRSELGGVGSGDLETGITYYKLKQLVRRQNDEWGWVGGVEAILYQVPGQQQTPTGATSTLPSLELEDERAFEGAIFGEVNWSPLDELSVQAGLRLNSYQYLGARTIQLYAEDGVYTLSSVVGTRTFAAGDVVESYQTLEPRFSARYQLGPEQSVRTGYSRTSQFVNQVFNTDTPTPQSQFQLSTSYIKPFLSHNFSLGYFRNFRNNRWETAVEGFYRAINQLWDYRDFAVLNLNPNLETELLEGQGRAYGVEASIKGRGLRFDGQLSYTYSRTEREVPGINRNEWYPSNFDQPHNVNFVFKYRIDERQSLNVNFTFASGRPTTAPIVSYSPNGGALTIPVYTQRNQLRIPDYHRLDISYNIAMNKKKERGFKTSWDFTIYNVYGRDNPFSVFYTQRVNQTRDFVANRLSVLGAIFPSVSFNFEWL